MFFIFKSKNMNFFRHKSYASVALKIIMKSECLIKYQHISPQKTRTEKSFMSVLEMDDTWQYIQSAVVQLCGDIFD